eukprot:2705677-Pleurochrysis_carterae.AAC.1
MAWRRAEINSITSVVTANSGALSSKIAPARRQGRAIRQQSVLSHARQHAAPRARVRASGHGCAWLGARVRACALPRVRACGVHAHANAHGTYSARACAVVRTPIRTRYSAQLLWH